MTADRLLLGLCVRLLRNDRELGHVERRGLEPVGGARSSGPAGSCGTTSLRLSATATSGGRQGDRKSA